MNKRKIFLTLNEKKIYAFDEASSKSMILMNLIHEEEKTINQRNAVH